MHFVFLVRASQDSIKPALGLSWSNCVNMRLMTCRTNLRLRVNCGLYCLCLHLLPAELLISPCLLTGAGHWVFGLRGGVLSTKHSHSPSLAHCDGTPYPHQSPHSTSTVCGDHLRIAVMLTNGRVPTSDRFLARQKKKKNRPPFTVLCESTSCSHT